MSFGKPVLAGTNSPPWPAADVRVPFRLVVGIESKAAVVHGVCAPGHVGERWGVPQDIGAEPPNLVRVERFDTKDRGPSLVRKIGTRLGTPGIGV